MRPVAIISQFITIFKEIFCNNLGTKLTSWNRARVCLILLGHGLAPACTWINPAGFQIYCHYLAFQKGPVKSAIDIPVPKWHHWVMERVVDEPRQRITARVSPSVRDTLEQAAELLGATVNQFVVQTAYVEAQRVIERESVIRLSQQDAQKVLALLEHPPKPNQRLKAAVKAFKGTVRA